MFLKKYMIILILFLAIIFNPSLILATSFEDLESYENLKNSLINVLNDKDFESKTKEIFIDTFDAIYENYYDYESTNIGLPKVNVYLKKNFIDLLQNNIDYVNSYDRESEEGKSFLDKIGAAYYMPGLKYISIVPPPKENIEEYNNYLAAVLHEVTHSNQENMTFSRDEFLGMILTEGGATYNQRLAVKPTNKLFLYESIENPENNMAIYTKVQDELGYSLYENSFYKLQMLIGYDEMEKLQTGGTYEDLINLINNKYGSSKAEKILKYMEESYIAPNKYKEKDTKERYNAAVNLEKEILNCIKMDINNLNSRESTIKYFNIYRNYKSKFLLNCVKTTNTNENHTNEIFDIKSIDDLMMKKTIEFKALSVHTKKEREENMIKMLLFSDFDKLQDQTIEIPYNLFTSKFAFDYDLNMHNLFLFNEYGDSIEFVSDRSGNMRISKNQRDYRKHNIFGYITIRKDYIELPDTGDKGFFEFIFLQNQLFLKRLNQLIFKQ